MNKKEGNIKTNFVEKLRNDNMVAFIFLQALIMLTFVDRSYDFCLLSKSN